MEQTPLGDVGWIGEGEWLEYTIEVDEVGAYNLELQLATNGGAGRTATVDFYQPGSDTPYASSGPVANPVTGGWTNFQPRTAEGIELQAGTQIVRVTFNGGSQDFREFTLELEETVDPNQQPVLETTLPAFIVDEDAPVVLNVSEAFSDPDTDDLTFTADGLPAGLSISENGLITGTAPTVNANTVSSVTVTATDTGGLSVDGSFDLTVADVPPVASGPIGEAGSVSVAQPDRATWFEVSFEVELENPSVVMGPMTLNGNQPATIRVQNVTSEGFEFKVDEWDYLDGGHIEETISWLAIEEGVHTLEGGQVVVAGIGSAAGSSSSISFGTDFGSAPVVLGQVTSAGQSQAVADRIDDVSATGFSVALDRQEAFNGAPHGSEAFSWIAIGKGGSAAEGLLVGSTGTGVSQNATTVNFGGSFSSDEFAFLADMQTENGGDPSVVRLASALMASGTSVFIEEEQSGDTELNHGGLEDVGYVAIELGSIFDQGNIA